MEKIKNKEFNLAELFDFVLSHDDIQPRNYKDGSTPLISSGKTNNGVTAHIDKQNYQVFPKNILTIDMFGKCFYQPEEFCAVSHGRVIICIPKFKINQRIGLYLSCIIEKTIAERFSFEEMCTGTKLKKLSIQLPIKNGDVDLNYIENYMKKLEIKVSGKLDKLKSAENIKGKVIDERGWKDFKVGQLFDIHPTARVKNKLGKDLTNKDLLFDNGNNRVVGNSAYNNGVIGYSKFENTENGNIITFSDTVDAYTIFYQKDPFIGYAHVQGLYPLQYNEKWNEYTLKFFCTILRATALRCNFDYSNKFRRDICKNLIVKLPVTNDNEIDFLFMEKFVKETENKNKMKLNNLIKVM